MTQIGKNIKNARKKLNITQEELAEKISVTRQAVSNWENGKTEPDIDTVTKIAQIFGISIDELVGGELNDPEKSRNFKIHLKLGIIFTAIFVVLLALIIIFEPLIQKYYEFYYIGMPKLFLDWLFKPIMIISGTLGLICLICYSTGFYIKNKYIRRAFIIIGSLLILFITIYLFYVLFSFIIAHFFTRGPKLFLGMNYYVFLVSYPLIHAIGPIFLSLGLIKNEGVKRCP
ncbi:MAG: helix-turn-helix transcriptional regulator [Oscillospiraceae bacterium]|nr:helix-turn-helix transcriptional regulator [Oscillospiraceae bacterium]